ncbi:MAG: cupredoxin domain-containing protein [Gemmatimonadaceae bacterium]
MTTTIAAARRRRRARGRLGAVAALMLVAACGRQAPDTGASAYRPRTRDITVTTVPLLVKEQMSAFPFLKPAFARGGVLDGKEVYAFVPSTITAVAGDTLRFTFVNPEDDAHSFVLPDLAVPLPGGTTTTATYVTRSAGIYPIVCAMANHLPMMSGQLVVLSATAMAGDSVVAGAASSDH